MGGLTLRGMELASNAISTRDANPATELYDIHESIEELEQAIHEAAEALVSGPDCDDARLERVLRSLRMSQLFVRISGRVLEVVPRSRRLSECVEIDGVRLLDPLFSRVHEQVRRMVTAYADGTPIEESEVRLDRAELKGGGEEMGHRLDERMLANREHAVAILQLQMVSRLVIEMGALALKGLEELRSREERSRRGNRGEGAFVQGSGPVI